MDTFQSSVAKEAVSAGADIVNDVSGGLMDDDMFATVRSQSPPAYHMVDGRHARPKKAISIPSEKPEFSSLCGKGGGALSYFSMTFAGRRVADPLHNDAHERHTTDDGFKREHVVHKRSTGI